MRALPREIILATHNAGKVRELEDLLRPLGVTVVGAAALGLPEPEETGATFAENARLKALAATRATGRPALADDSGLAVAGLDGAPGVHSARWAGPSRDFAAAMRRVVEELSRRHGSFIAADRRATFVAVLCLAWSDGTSELFEGRVAGEIVEHPRGAGGFGYDPLFVPEGEGQTFAELPAARKQAISHRRRALDALLASLGVMKLLVVGGGGREHALCWALAASPMVDELLCAPGNAGIAQEATCVDIAPDDLDGLVRLARNRAIDLVVVGPELPLTLGLVDRLQAAGIKALGPTAAAARLEGSKAFAKAFCARHAIPTAASRSFTRAEATAAAAHVRDRGGPIVVKADGLAAGKGVIVAPTIEEALTALDELFASPAGAAVVVEECLTGPEASLFALCDGTTALEIGTAQDHKRAFDGERGPNTGGMGAFSPNPRLDAAATERIMAEIVRPTLAGMAAEGTPFMGILYAGLMLTADGPKLVEFNVRFGDPECQAVLPRLRTDLCQLLLGAVDGQLAHMDLRWEPLHALTVVMASRGYPAAYGRGSVIRALDRVGDGSDVLLFHAGTVRNAEGHIAAAGGRVLDVTGLGATLAQARERAYGAVRRLDWPEGFYRTDIGA